MRPPANLSDRTSRDRAAAARTVHHVRALSVKAPAYRAPRRSPGPGTAFLAAAAARLAAGRAAFAPKPRAATAELVSTVREDWRVRNALLLQKRKAEHEARFGTLPAPTARRLPTPPREPFRVKPPAPVVGYAPRRK